MQSIVVTDECRIDKVHIIVRFSDPLSFLSLAWRAVW